MKSRRVLVLGCWLALGLSLAACSSSSPKPPNHDGGTGGRDGGSGGDAGIDMAINRDGATTDATMTACVPNPAGNTASGKSCCSASDCGSGFCADGVCCDSACKGTCTRCDLIDSPGTCKPVPDGLAARKGDCSVSDVKTCGLDGMCDGKGKCRDYPAGAVSAPGTCDGGDLSHRLVCDGQGSSIPGSARSCTPYICKDDKCPETCVSDADCVAGVTCIGGQCGTTQANGRACSKDAQCASTHCADGVCCNAACDGLCSSCNQPQNLGQCVPLGEGQPEPKCAKSDVATCGLSGACDRWGECGLYKVETPCIPQTCSGSTKTTAGTCDGNGTCRPPGQVDCSPIMCGSDDCLSACKTSKDCVAPNLCTNGSCGPGPMGVACTTAAQCQSGNCVDGVCCDTVCTGACQSCSLQSSLGRCTNVGANEKDPHGICKDMGTASCKTNSLCDGNGGCQSYPSGTQCAAETCVGGAYTGPSTCNDSNQCLPPPSITCNPYTCNGSKCFDSCTQNSQCVTKFCDANHSCGPKPPGAQCSQASECQPAPDGNKYCSQGVCCTSPCSNACQACNLSGNGTCTNVPNGSRDPQAKCSTTDASGCKTTGKCQNGGCENYSSSTQCKAASCSAGSKQATSAYCDGKGDACPAQGSKDCGVYTCNSSTGLCRTTCGSNADCTSPNVCNNGSCGLAPNGASCGNKNQCLSGNCTEGVCCNTACSGLSTGTCTSCVVQNHVGTCTNVPIGGNDPGGRCTKSVTTSCGLSGTCDGGGKCDYWDTNISCRNQSCSGSTQSNAAYCDGNGTCNASTTKDCGNYACNGASCKTSCTADTDCKSGVKCNTVLNTCGTTVANGQKCGIDSDCASNACVQGTGGTKICCATACTADSASSPSCLTGQCTATGTGAGTCALKASGATCGAAGSCSGTKATSARTCNASGVCMAATVTTCAPMDQCHNASTCTGGVCSPVTNMSDGTGCDNTTICDGRETCQGGMCKTVAGTPLSCSPTICQTNASCDAKNGCQFTNKLDGTDCSTTCTGGKMASCKTGVCGTCTAPATGGTTGTGGGSGGSGGITGSGGGGGKAGGCTAASDCDDKNPCTTDSCSSGACKNTVSLGAPCNDGNACTTTDTCDATGKCMGSGAPTCPQPTGQCQVAGCAPATGCTIQTAPAGTACNDNNMCTLTDTCDTTGKCMGSGAPTCPQPTGQCQVAGCAPATGCTIETAPAGTSCNDSNMCTLTDKCDATGKCMGSGAPTCEPSTVCKTVTCDPTTGCKSTNNNNVDCSTTCPSGMNGTCSNGSCNCVAVTPPPGSGSGGMTGSGGSTGTPDAGQ